MPSLFDDSPDLTLTADQQTVLDALCFLQAPINITRLAEFLGDHHTARGAHFHGPELPRRRGELQQAKRVGNPTQGQWFAPPEAAWPRFVTLLRSPAPPGHRWGGGGGGGRRRPPPRP